MSLISYKRGQGSVILRVKILDSSATTGAGKTGLAYNTSGLIISTIADNESSATAYTVAGSTIETISTLGTYAAPTATKCRFKEVDSTNHKGIYEIQIADARFAVSNAKSLLVSISGASGAAETDFVVPLQDLDPYDAVRGGMTSLPNATAGANNGLPVLGGAIPNVTAGSNGGLPLVGSQIPNATAGANTGLPVVGTQIPNATAGASGGLPLQGGAIPNANAGVTSGLPVVGTQIPNANAGANGGLPLQGGAIPNANANAAGGLLTAGTGANQINPSGTGQVGIDLTNIKQATAPTTLTNITVPTVTSITNGVSVASNLKKGQALSGFQFYMALSSDHVSPATGKVVTATRSLDGNAFSACTNSPAEIGNGWYAINLSTSDMSANTIALSFAATACDTTLITLATQP